MLEELYNPTVVPKVYWWRSRAFRISLAIFVALAVLAVVLFNQQLGSLLRLFGSKASGISTITLTATTDTTTGFLNYGYSATPSNSSFQIKDGQLMLNPPANNTGE